MKEENVTQSNETKPEDSFVQQRKSTVFYEAWYETIEKLPTLKEKLKAFEYIFNYSFYGELPDEEDITTANIIFSMAKENIIAAHNRYDSSVSNGKLGGRPEKIDKNLIIDLKNQGKTNKEIAEKLNISTKTVQRALDKRQNQRHNHNVNDNVNDNVNVNNNDKTASPYDGAEAPNEQTEQTNEQTFNLSTKKKVIKCYNNGMKYNKDNPQIQIATGLSGSAIHYIIEEYLSNGKSFIEDKPKNIGIHNINGTLTGYTSEDIKLVLKDENMPTYNDCKKLYLLWSGHDSNILANPTEVRDVIFDKYGFDVFLSEKEQQQIQTV